ncbi:unnamed protein product [Prunus armeniaca]|uniref:BZIP domain-containing protein n=1 Tax=Prunus armeniaca TaxID=36596 RepID=A0A6J5VVI7_PRUAR|nr:unnamed protein product [Prunus armeniaca]
MSSVQQQSSSGSDGSATVDEKKRKRMLSNRESARRSRMKKQKQMDDLTSEITRLEMSNNQLQQGIEVKERGYSEIESRNNVMRAQVMELTDRLQSLNSVLQIFEEVSGLAVDIPEIPDPLLRPWQVSYPTQLIPASSDITYPNGLGWIVNCRLARGKIFIQQHVVAICMVNLRRVLGHKDQNKPMDRGLPPL